MTRCVPRGLTLLEVLAAMIMLALLAATCTPIIAKSIALVRQENVSSTSGARVTLPELGEVADAFLVDPKRFGVLGLQIHEVEAVEFVCPERFDEHSSRTWTLAGRVVRIGRLARAERPDHIWLVFECGQARVVRWVSLPDAPESDQRSTSRAGAGPGGGAGGTS